MRTFERITLAMFLAMYALFIFLDYGGFEYILKRILQSPLDFPPNLFTDIDEIFWVNAAIFALPAVTALLVRSSVFNCFYAFLTSLELGGWWAAGERILADPANIPLKMKGLSFFVAVPAPFVCLPVLFVWLLFKIYSGYRAYHGGRSNSVSALKLPPHRNRQKQG